MTPTAPTIEQLKTRLAVMDSHYQESMFHGDWPVLGKQVHDAEVAAIRSVLLSHAEVVKERDGLMAEVGRLEKRCEECVAVRPERLGQLADEAGGATGFGKTNAQGAAASSSQEEALPVSKNLTPAESPGLSLDDEMEHWVRSWRTVCQKGGCDTCQLSRGGPAKAECERYAALIKARLSSPAPDADERALSRCTCRPEYKDRGLSDPQCPFHSMTDREWLARELDIEVSE